ncbi:MAG: aldo/keto reductase [Armatimonadetes bacterium]|nr:aldo/keto reductase [Armatimonadota bacterium]
METVAYGNTGLMVSRLCIGCGHFQKAYPNVEDGGRFLERVLERGVTFWDTAESYGSHPHIAAAFRRVDRSRVILQTKTTEKSRAGAAARIDAILRELGTDTIDIILLHAIDSPRDLRQRAGALQAMLDAKAAGKVRHVGCSTHVYTGPAMDAVTAGAEMEVILCLGNKGGVMLEGSIIDPDPAAPRDPERPSLAAHIEQIRRAYEAGKGISIMKILSGGQTPEADREGWIRWGFEFPYAHAVNLGITYEPELELDLRLEEEICHARRAAGV